MLKQFILDQKLLDVLSFYKKLYFAKNKSISLSRKKNNVFIIGVPQYKNLGDHAIAEAIVEYLNNNLNEYNIVEVPIDDFGNQYSFIKKNSSNKDIFILIGGGNFGIEYYIMELQRRTIIKHFKNNKIILFPQTIDFGSTKFGRKELRKSIKIYSKHKDLYLFAREKTSYDIMKENFDNPVYLTPDIVLSIPPIEKNQIKNMENKILLCMRNDCEKIYNDIEIKEILHNMNYSYYQYDTVVDHNILIKERNCELNKCFNLFSSYKLIITDRLHGMIFSYLTGTPCIVLSNYNHKIKGVYNSWLKDVTFIKYCDDVKQIKKSITELLDTKIEYKTFADSFCQLKKILDE